MDSYSRIRSIKLKRPTPDHPFGFSVRGGHEHGTGIFVSYVDTRSTAYRQGLKVGDQILRVNGYPVSATVHHECLSLMRTRTSLHLKVRSVGMLPVKEKTGDPLTWKLVEEQPCPPLLSSDDLTNDHDSHGNNRHAQVNSRMSDTSSQPDSRTEFHGNEAKIFIDTTGQSGLGCCICKGPPERPGIFVQSTKSSGVAREAGLRPGDQVLACNGHSFLHIPFAEAVYYLKQSKHLNLIVLKGAASDLFPGESSGYNSSASSLNGDIHASSGSNAPSESSASISTTGPGDIIVHDNEQANKRLSMVTEENGTRDENEGASGKRNIALDKNMEWDEVEQAWHKAEKETIVIEVRGEDPQGRIRSEEERLAEERRKLEEEQKRLVEEAHRLEEEKRKFEEEKRRTLQKSPSLVSSSSSSAESANSLQGALNQEILKRVERRENNPHPQPKEDERPKPGTVEQKKSIFSTAIDQEKRQQHEQLIEEFKRAHRKMFAHTLDGEAKDGGAIIPGESEAQRSRRIQKEIDHERNMVAQRVAGIVRQRQLRIERQHQECAETEREVSKHVIRNKSPPPPPPECGAHAKSKPGSSSKWTYQNKGQLPPSSLLDSAKEQAANNKKEKSVSFQTASSPTPPKIPSSGVLKQPSSSQKNQKLSQFTTKTVIIEERNGHASPTTMEEVPKRSANLQKPKSPPPPSPQQQQHQQEPHSPATHPRPRPESPSPDYSNSPSPSPSPPRIRSPPMGGVDMESLESFRLKNPPKNVTKPPPFYFNEAAMHAAAKQQAQGQTPNLSHYTVGNGMDDKMVRMAAYPSAYSRPEPSRLGFIGKGPAPMVPNGVKAEVILHRELEDALSRCNLNGCNSNGGGGGGGNPSSNAKMMMHHNQCQSQNSVQHHQNDGNYCNGKCSSSNGPTKTGHHHHQVNGKPNGGGILKISNGNGGSGNSSSNKTISFGGRY